MISDKTTIPFSRLLKIWLLGGIATVLVLVAWGYLAHKGFSFGNLAIYLAQGSMFLLAALWALSTIGLNLKVALSNCGANFKTDLRLALKYFFVYFVSIIGLIALVVLVALAMRMMGLFDMAAFTSHKAANTLRQSEMSYLLYLVELPVKFILYLLATSVLIPIGEEIFFRRLLFVSLRYRMAFLPSLFISSVLFGAGHLGNGAISAFVIGLFLGWIYEKHQNMSVNIIVHGLINFSVVLVMVFLAII